MMLDPQTYVGGGAFTAVHDALRVLFIRPEILPAARYANYPHQALKGKEAILYLCGK